MKFHLDFEPEPAPRTISHHDALVLAGSCFAEHIGKKLREHRFACTVNPGGLFFDAASLARFFSEVAGAVQPPANHVLRRSDRFFSYLHHSTVSAGSPKAVSDLHDTLINETRKDLEKAGFLVVSLGTAYTHYYAAAGFPAANCHKQPANLFEKRLVSAHDIVKLFTEAILALRKLNGGLE